MNKKRKISVQQKNSLIYLKNNLKRLAAPFEQQYAETEEFAQWNLVDDIISDWENYNTNVDYLVKTNIIDKETEKDIHILVGNFDDNIFDTNINESVWTLEGMKTHPFWEEQRKLAKKILLKIKND